MPAGVLSRETVPPDFATRLRGLRTSLGLTQMRLAELMGVSFVSINRWENGQNRPSSRMWSRISTAEQYGIEAFSPRFVPPSELAETAMPYGAKPSEPDFTGNPEALKAVAEAERLSFGHLYNPAFATEVSLIDPLPHQRLAVYEHMLREPRLRFLLADDAGAGKTIMAGLYIREMFSRRLIRRVLVVPPAGLVGNWKREMHTLFRLPFRIVSGADARDENPFVGPDSDRLIVSVDTLAGERMFSRLQEASVAPYDLVIFDEAHKLSARRDPDGTVRKTDRYSLAEALAGASDGHPRWHLGWNVQHLLLLTATPHMGKSFPYYCLWRLLEPEALSTEDAFDAFPESARRRYFLRRVKEEMVRFDGTRIYPTRTSDTFSYNLTQGDASEQRLYDGTTSYIQTYYNRARILNRTAARLAMSVFQRRLASSTYALLRSFERRLEKVDTLIEKVRSGELTFDQLALFQKRLDQVPDVLDTTTADEERPEDGKEQNEVTEDQTLGGVLATTLGELEAERHQVHELLSLAKRVYDTGAESKFEKLRDQIRGGRSQADKILIFTEHRDTLTFLVRKLEGLGFTGKVAQIHGGMDYRERDEQVEFFRKAAADGGATFLVGTDAAGEGINLQFCWLMINYDIPWNPARLEQRMGRIHRYGQQHDPVLIVNLVAGTTREGRVLKTLLDKLENIRKELGSDKVFDVVGRLFEGISLREFMEDATRDEGAENAVRRIEGTLTKEQVQALEERERLLYGEGGDVQRELPRLRIDIEQESYRRLLPGYVRLFIERVVPLVSIGIEGEIEGRFNFRALKSGALDPLLPALDSYSGEERRNLTLYRPRDSRDAIWLHPGEPVFDSLRAYVIARLESESLQGAAFVDPTAERPYLFHVAVISVERAADSACRALSRAETLEYRLIGLKQEEGGRIEECPVEHLLLLRGAKSFPVEAAAFAQTANESRDLAVAYGIERVGQPLAEEKSRRLAEELPSREDFLRRGFDYQDAGLAARRAQISERARGGDALARAELARVKERQRELIARREEALATLRREPDLIGPGEVRLLAHALVVPSMDPEERKRHDEAVEAIAVRVAWVYEDARGCSVTDVSTPSKALGAGLTERPGFDLLSRHPEGERAIEVKGRAGVGDIDVSENEWAKACNLRDRYWLYVVFGCASPHPRLVRIQDPFGKLLVKARGGVVIDEREILAVGEP